MVLIDVEEINLPSTLAQIGTGSLVGFVRVEDIDGSNPTMQGSTTIYANTIENNLTEFVFTNAFDCVLQLPTGDRYAFVDGVLKKLGTSTTFQKKHRVALSKSEKI